jgi:hypothetical protein
MTENVMKHITPGRRAGQDFPVSDMWIPRFWSGSFSPARPGNSCSQQVAELMIKTIKRGKERKKQREKREKKEKKRKNRNKKHNTWVKLLRS